MIKALETKTWLHWVGLCPRPFHW